MGGAAEKKPSAGAASIETISGTTEAKKPANPATGPSANQLPTTDTVLSGVLKKLTGPLKTDISGKPASATANSNSKPAPATANTNGKPAPAEANVNSKPAPPGANISGKPAPAAPASGGKPTLPAPASTAGNQPTAGSKSEPAKESTTGASPANAALQCPGDSLTACVQVCPGSSARLYGACVQGCGDRCLQ